MTSLNQILSLLSVTVMASLAGCDKCALSTDAYCGDEEDDKKPAEETDSKPRVSVCESVPDTDGMCSDLVPQDVAQVNTVIARGGFTGSTVSVGDLTGDTFDLVSVEYSVANEFSTRAIESCDIVLQKRQAAGDLRASRRFTALGNGAYLDEDVRRSGSEELRFVRIVGSSSPLMPNTTCKSCSSFGTGSNLTTRLVETRVRGSATRDRLLADGARTNGRLDRFVLVEAVAYLPPGLPDQDYSVVDCEAAMHYQRRGK